MSYTMIDPRTAHTLTAEQRKKAICCVYFVRVGDYIKIGCSHRWRRRITNIRTASPFEVEVLHVELNNVGHEKVLHRRFKALHHRGEWFHAKEPLLSYIEERSKQFARNIALHKGGYW